MQQTSLWSKSFITLVLLTGVSLAGFSFIWPLTTLYVTHVLGKPMSVAGVVLAMEAASGMVGNFVGGVLFDYLNGKWLMGVSALLVAVASLSLVAWHSWWVFLFSYAIINFCIGALLTLVNAAVSQVCPQGDRRAYNFVYISRNVGVSAGVFLGGIVASTSFTYAFLLNGLCFALLPLLVWIGLRNTPLRPLKRATNESAPSSVANLARSRRFMFVMLGIGGLFTMVSYMQWQSTISVYLQALGQPLAVYSLLWTINGILAIVLQPLSQYLFRFIPSERAQMVVGEFVFVLSFVVIILVPSSGGFVVAMVLTTVAEVMVWPIIPAMTAKLAPDGKGGFYQGMINVCNSAGRLVGPMTGAALYQWIGASSMMWIMTVAYGIAMVCFACCRPQQVRGQLAASSKGTHQLQT